MPCDKLFIRVDKTRLLQIILNLISNAIKFTPHDGRITIRVSVVNNSSIRIQVEDTGIGMTKEELEILFKRYIQANRRIATEYGGSGLGLEISKRLSELMGGELSIESEKDHGTKITVALTAEILPITQPLSSETPTPPPLPPSCSHPL